MKKAYNLDVEWKPFEIHPGVPAQGMPVSAFGTQESLRGVAENIRRLAADSGLIFKQPRVIANSHLALAAAEFARDHYCFDVFHRRVFQAVYQAESNIGDLAVLTEIAAGCGLDPKQLTKALAEGRYENRLDEARREAEDYGISAAPTFVIEGKYMVVGAQPYSVFKHAIERVMTKRHDNRL